MAQQTNKKDNSTQVTIKKVAAMNRFRISDISNHTHTGINSPQTYQPSISYAGMIGLTNFGILPTGWTATSGGTGDIIVTHNLGTFAYTVVASPVGLLGFVDITPGNNSIEFSWFATNGSTPQATPFTFIVLAFTNPKAILPTYQSSTYLTTGVLT